MPTTPLFEIPYPGPGDPDNVPVDLFALAEWLENNLPRSGTYTPAVVNGDNVISSAAPHPFIWTHVGDVVTVDGFITTDPVAAGTSTVHVPVPVPTAAFTDVTDLCGIGVRESTGEIPAGVANVSAIPGGIGLDYARVRFVAPDGTALSLRIHFTYRVT